MIEIERQFLLEPGHRDALLRDANFMATKIIKDVYYDTPDFALTRRDLWLRKRNDVFELKAPAVTGDDRAEQYLEIMDTSLMLRYMHLEDAGDFATTLAQHNIQPFCACNIEREEYVLEGITLDFDITEFADGFQYSLGEAEIVVKDKSETEEAVQRLEEFMQRHGLETRAEDKLVAYLRAQRQEHFDILREAGVL